MKINTKPFEDALEFAENKMSSGPITIAFYKELIKLAEAVNAMMPEQTEILPCLFCGNQPEIEEYQGEWRVSCFDPDSHCFYTLHYGDKEKAITKWNERK